MRPERRFIYASQLRVQRTQRRQRMQRGACSACSAAHAARAALSPRDLPGTLWRRRARACMCMHARRRVRAAALRRCDACACPRRDTVPPHMYSRRASNSGPGFSTTWCAKRSDEKIGTLSGNELMRGGAGRRQGSGFQRSTSQCQGQGVRGSEGRRELRHSPPVLAIAYSPP